MNNRIIINKIDSLKNSLNSNYYQNIISELNNLADNDVDQLVQKEQKLLEENEIQFYILNMITFYQDMLKKLDSTVENNSSISLMNKEGLIESIYSSYEDFMIDNTLIKDNLNFSYVGTLMTTLLKINVQFQNIQDYLNQLNKTNIIKITENIYKIFTDKEEKIKNLNKLMKDYNVNETNFISIENIDNIDQEISEIFQNILSKDNQVNMN